MEHFRIANDVTDVADTDIDVDTDILAALPKMASLPEPGPLAVATIAAVRETFKGYEDHEPAEPFFEGMTAIATVLEGMANGTLKPNFYVSRLPPGIGKTTVLIESVRQILNTPEYDDIGIIIFIERVAEIAKVAEQLDLSERDYSVLVSDSYYLGKDDKGNKTGVVPRGNLTPSEARVLFTTQAGLDARLSRVRSEGKDSFAAIEEFWYKGKPREVRAWDEAILPAKHLTVDHWDINGLHKPLGVNKHEAVIPILEKLVEDMKAVRDRYSNAETLSLMVPTEICQLVPQHALEDEDWQTLWKMSGKHVIVQKNGGASVALSYEENFPEDFAPLLILDASGEYSQTYKDWFASPQRGNLEYLQSHDKKYTGLTVHHWNRGSGREVHQKEKSLSPIVNGIVNAIKGIPDKEPVLVVTFKPAGRHIGNYKGNGILDLPSRVRSWVKWRNNDTLSFLTWGQHTATNDYHEFKHVILASLYQYPPAAYEAMLRGTRKMTNEQKAEAADLRNTRLGEVMSHVYQAACRGKVRATEGDSCPEGVHLYVIYSTQGELGIPETFMTDIFPGATVEPWEPLGDRLTKPEEACLAFAKAHLDKILPSKEFAEAVNVDPRNVKRALSDRVVELLEAEGIRANRKYGEVLFERIRKGARSVYDIGS